MEKVMAVKARRTNPLEHPAVRAWRKLGAETAQPKRIRALQRDRKKSAVYSLSGVGVRASNVIAKQCWKRIALVERDIYEEVLPHLPIPALRYYGCVEDENSEICWSFVEDASGKKFSPKIEEHCALAARWLGLMHTHAARVPAAAQLPDRGTGYHLERLRTSRRIILHHLANPVLAAGDRSVLKSTLSHLDLLELRWSRVEECCDRMPRTLVHTDFVGKNMRVRTGPAGPALLPFDWEDAGWGVPAADLQFFSLYPVDPAPYWSIVRQFWPCLDLREIRLQANLGRVFRTLAEIYWVSESIESEWFHKYIGLLRFWRPRLAGAIQAVRWED